MFDENDDGYWWGDEPDYSSPEQATDPTQQHMGGYGDTSGAGIYDESKNDYWSPMYTPTTQWGATNQTSPTLPGIGKASTTPERRTSTGGKTASTGGGGGALRVQPILRSSTTTSTTTPVAPSGPAPIAPEAGEFEGPEWDKRYIARMAQEKSAPGIRQLRTAYQQAAGQSFENPNVKAMMLREALGGYGQGLQHVRAGGEDSALREYSEKYGRDWQGEAMEYQTNARYELAAYNATWQNYLRQYGTETSSTTSRDYQMITTGAGVGTSSTPGYTSSSLDADGDTGYGRSLSGGMAYPGKSMSTFINPKTHAWG